MDEDALLNAKTVARMLGISPHFVRMLEETGILPDTRCSRVTEMSHRSVLVPSGAEQPVLRTGVEGFDAGEQRVIGYSDDMSDVDVVEANRKWWRADPDKIINARYLPVSCGSFIVALLVIDGLDESARVEATDKNGKPFTEVRHSFKARLVARHDAETGATVMHSSDADDIEAANLLVGHFQRSVSGGPIAYL
jgi:hypothetical protein